MPTDLSPSIVSPYHQSRTRMCGAPIHLLRESGEVTPAWYSCRWRHCTRCARHYAARVTSCATEKLDEAGVAESVVMLTLTQPHAAGLGTGDFRRELREHRAIWDAMSTRLRWWRHRRGRGDVGADDEIPPPRLRHGRRRGEPHPDWTHTFDGVHWTAPCDDDGVIWALEVTAGQNPKGWHIHRHVLCTSRDVAERMNAAWQAAAADVGAVAEGEWTSTDIQTMDGPAAVRYLVAYMSGKNELDALPNDDARSALIRSAKHMQRHNARGSLRPLGIAPPRPDDEVTHVRLRGHGDIPASEFWKNSSVWRETRADRPLTGGPLSASSWGASLPSRVTPCPWLTDPDDQRPPRERALWLAEHPEHVDAVAHPVTRLHTDDAGARHVVPVSHTPEDERRERTRDQIRRRLRIRAGPMGQTLARAP